MRMNERAALPNAVQQQERTTLLALVQALTRTGSSDRDVVSEVLRRVESGRAVLIGSFRDTPLRVTQPGKPAGWHGD